MVKLRCEHESKNALQKRTKYSSRYQGGDTVINQPSATAVPVLPMKRPMQPLMGKPSTAMIGDLQYGPRGLTAQTAITHFML